MKNMFFKDRHLPFVECRYTENSTLCYKEHFHESLSVGAVINGEVLFTCNDKTYTLAKNALALINAKELHSCNPKNDKPRSYFMLYIDLEYLGFGDLIFHDAKIKSKKLYDIFIRLNKTLLDDKKFYMQKEATLYEFLEILLKIDGGKNSTKEKDSIKKAQDFMKKNIDKNITIDDMCKNIGFSKFHFIRDFKTKTHTTPHAYMLNLKINEAKRLLEKNEDISLVSQKLGFFDQSHLNRVFKGLTTLTPKEYQVSQI